MRTCLSLIATMAPALACGDSVRGCTTEKNNAAAQSGIQVDVEPPFRCDYTVRTQGATIDFIVHFRAPDSWYAGRQTVHAMFAKFGLDWLPVGDGMTMFWRSGPECDGSPACMGLLVQYAAATGTPEFDKYSDQYRAAGATPIGDAVFQMTITGRLGALADVGGPGGLPSASAGTWTADVAWDTLSYRYQWYVDGSPVSGATQRSYVRTFYEESGTQHTISVVAQLMDGSTQTQAKTVTLQMLAGWSGPPTIEAYQMGTWSGTATGARLPLTSCEWWFDATIVESSSCILNYAFSSTGSYGLSVIVTDSRGVSASSPAFAVQVTTPGCQPPECYESMRAPPGHKSSARPTPSRGLPQRP